MKRVFLTLLLGILGVSHLYAQWIKTSGPDGGYTNDIVQVGTTLAVSAGNGGVFRSENNGESWVAANTGLPFNGSVQALVAHNGLLYVSMYGNGIYFSADKGETWSPINSGIEGLTFYNFVVEGTELWAGNANGGVYYSPDNGTTWTEKSSGVADIQFQDFTVFNNEIYGAGTSLFKSSNKGDTWEKVEIAGLGPNGVRSMVATADAFYVSDNNHVFVSTNNLATWEKSTLNTYASIVTMGVSGDSVFLTTSNGRMFYTKDQGVKWNLVQNPLTENFAHDVMLLQDKIIMSTWEGLYESHDGGNTWAMNNAGISTHNITALAANSSFIFAGTENQGVFRSENEGESWERSSSGLDALNASYISGIVAFEDKIVSGTGGGVYTSMDDGASWTQTLDPGINKLVQALAFDEGSLAAAVNGTGVYLSLDTAETWYLAGTEGLNIETSYESILLHGDTIVLSTHNGEIFLSKDLGKSWTDISITGDYYFTFDLELDGGKIYAATAKGVLVSEDMGVSWRFFNNLYLQATDLLVLDKKLIAATNSGIYVTTESRNTWYNASDGIGSSYVNKLRLKGDFLFAGTANSSVWKRPLEEINLPPVITGLSGTVNILEDSSLVLNLKDLVIDDPDSSMSEDFSLTINEGSNYSVKDSLVSPVNNFNGLLTVPVSLSDGIANGPVFNLGIEVLPVNDKPVIVSVENELVTTEGAPLEVKLSDLNVEDPDNTFPNGFALSIQEGENYSASNNIITPDSGFTGNLNVPLLVNDGTDDSPVYQAVVMVTEVTGVEEGDEFYEWEVYPNPASEQIKISNKNGISGSILLQLYSLKGEEALTKQFNSSGIPVSLVLNVRNIPTGLYFIHLTSSTGTRFFKKINIK